MAHQVRTIARQRLGHALGARDDNVLRQAIQQAIRGYFDLD
jgi:mRNA-degrading endonuclease toxin of MazEF toxin-antitoxin module